MYCSRFITNINETRRCSGVYRHYSHETRRKEEHAFNGGLFHGWGMDYEELENGVGSFTIALVELTDRRIVTVLPGDLVFE